MKSEQNKTENLIIFQNAYSVAKEKQKKKEEDKNKKNGIYLCVIFYEYFFYTFNESGVWQHQNIMTYWEMFQQLKESKKKRFTVHNG